MNSKDISWADIFAIRTELKELHYQTDNSEKPSESGLKSTQVDNLVIASMKSYAKNTFVQFLKSKIQNDDVVSDLINRFRIGTKRDGAAIFWQVDINGKVDYFALCNFNPITGECITTPNLTKIPHFFGENQLVSENKTIAIVEKVETAILMSWIMPQNTWIAFGNCEPVYMMFDILKNKKIVLYPDAGKYELWSKMAKNLKQNRNLDVKVSTYLKTEIEKLPFEQHKGIINLYDCAIRFNWKPQPQKKESVSQSEQVFQNMILQKPILKKFINRLELIYT